MTIRRHNTWERLSNAVEQLAIGPEPIQTRLGGAFLTIIPLRAADFPTPDHGKIFNDIIEELSGTELEYDDNNAPIRLISDERARIVAYKIFHLYDDIACAYCSGSLSDAISEDISTFERVYSDPGK